MRTSYRMIKEVDKAYKE